MPVSGLTGGGGPAGLQRAESTGGSEWRGGPGAARLPHCLHCYTHCAAPCVLQGCVAAFFSSTVQVSGNSENVGCFGKISGEWSGVFMGDDILLCRSFDVQV